MSDEIFDSLAGVFLNLNKNADILRSNKALASELQMEHEDVLGINMSKLFSGEAWQEFDLQFQKLVSDEAKIVEFELPLKVGSGQFRDFLWQISQMNARHGGRHEPIFTCIGRDISEVKSALSKVVSMAKDLELAEAVQNLLLPTQPELVTPTVSMAAYYKSASISGGDFWSFDFVNQNTIWILVGDVTGHGAGSAMVTAMVAGCVRTLKFVAEAGGIKIDLPMVISSINQNLLNISGQPYWMTLVAAEIDLSKNSLTWWGAGAPDIFSLPQNGEVHLLSDISSPLGAGPCNLSTGQSSFGKGHRLLLFTDGVTEIENEAGVQLGTRRLRKFMKETEGSTIPEARSRLLELLDKWGGKAAAKDDITFLFIDRQ